LTGQSGACVRGCGEAKFGGRGRARVGGGGGENFEAKVETRKVDTVNGAHAES